MRKSIHNYIQYHCNINHKSDIMQGKISRLSYNAIYTKSDVKTRKGKWHSVFKENVRYTLCESQYWMGCA